MTYTGLITQQAFGAPMSAASINLITLYMEIKILSVDQFNELMTRLNEIAEVLETIDRNPLENKWLNTKEAAEALGISIRSLQEKRNRLEIPFSQYGSIIRYRAEDIQQYLMDHFIKPRFGRKSHE